MHLVSKIYFKCLIVLLPFLLVLFSFVFIDPFGVIHNQTPRYETSSDYETTRLYLRNTENTKYNAFIFGNSKTLAFTSDDWKKHINNGVFYKFGAPGESIFNIYNKTKLITQNGDRLDHVIMVLDAAMIKNVANTNEYLQGPVYKHHPYTQDESWLTFYSAFFNYYLTDFFFLKVLKDCFKPPLTVSQKQDFLKTKKDFNPQTNEFCLSDLENEIRNKGFAEYYQNHLKEFNNGAKSRPSVKNLDPTDINYLSEIKKIFEEQRTDYNIIIGPVRNGIKFPEKATNALQVIFGKENIYDFSDYKKITGDSSYFYEWQHYRPVAGALMLDEIYH